MNSTIKSRFHPKNNLLQPSNSYKEAARQFFSFVHEHGSSQQCTRFVQCLCLISRYARVNTLADTRGVNIGERTSTRSHASTLSLCPLYETIHTDCFSMDDEHFVGISQLKQRTRNILF